MLNSSPKPRSRRQTQVATAPRPVDLNWRQLPLLTVKDAAKIAGVSTATLYGCAHKGTLKFKRLAGRTLVETASLIALVDDAEDWTPSTRSAAAVATRAARARQSWEGAQ